MNLQKFFKDTQKAQAIGIIAMTSLALGLFLLVFYVWNISREEVLQTDQTDEVVSELYNEGYLSQDTEIETLPYTGETFEITDAQKSAVMAKTAVVKIFNRSCADVVLHTEETSKTYEVCLAGFGTGFYINKDGVLVTNAHVAAIHEVDLVIDALLYGYDPDGLFDDFFDLIYDYEEESWDEEEWEEYRLSTSYGGGYYDYWIASEIIEGLEEGTVEIKNVAYSNYIQKDQPFEVNDRDFTLENASSHFKADLVAYKKIESFYELSYQEYTEDATGISVPDLAILQIAAESENFDYPAIKLGNAETISVGQPISVIGYPGIVDNRFLFSQSSSKVATVTTGTVSAVRKSFGGNFDLVQIDASISFGNSGGPIINTNGEVIGVTTYGISMYESADFNAGISVAELHNIIEQEDISTNVGEITRLIEQGFNNLSAGYYSRAVEDFELAILKNPSVADEIDPLIVYASNKIDSGEDQTPMFEIGSIAVQRYEFVGLMIALILFSVGGILILFLVASGITLKSIFQKI